VEILFEALDFKEYINGGQTSPQSDEKYPYGLTDILHSLVHAAFSRQRLTEI
jgi:hypothetical protein